jgi:steroid delta-isomerase-like uncharacterized protein
MSIEENKSVVLQGWYQELWDKWNIELADELFTADYLLHLTGVPDALSRDAIKQVLAMFNRAFPDLRHAVDEMIAEGNTVAARWTVTGTHTGEFQGIAATGKSVRLSGITVHHLAGGRIKETWLAVDNLELMQQIGAIPQPGRAA